MTTAGARHPSGWFKASRSPVALELIRANRCAFLLLYVIAARARWHEGFNAHGLEPGEAFIGDHEAYGMTRREYRTAMMVLGKHGFAAFQATNRGTVATLCHSEVFDIGLDHDGQQTGEQAASIRPAGGHQPASARPLTKKERREKKVKKGKTEGIPGECLRPSFDSASPSPRVGEDSMWLASLEADPTYSGISIRTEFGKMSRWCETHCKQPTRRRFINWLNRADRPLAAAPSATATDYSQGF